jgi:hypothetical protein
LAFTVIGISVGQAWRTGPHAPWWPGRDMSAHLIGASPGIMGSWSAERRHVARGGAKWFDGGVHRGHASRVDQRHEWFKEGAQAFRWVQAQLGRAHLLPPATDLYPCPLCLRGFYTIEAIEAGELTREHVPPHSLGGHWLVLTCRACNNDAGRFYDAEAEKQERMRSFLTGHHQGLIRGTYTVNGVSHRGEMHLAPMLGDGPAAITFVGPDAKEGDPVVIASTNGGMGMYFQSVAKVNNPPEARRFEQVLGAAVDNQEQINVDLKPGFRFSVERARVSWVRSAYLVAFAALGWSYILQESLAQVRNQFQAHEDAFFPEIALYDHGTNSDLREILLIAEPSACRSVMVAMGAHVVFLPVPGESRSLSELASAVQAHYHRARNSQTPLTFVGSPIPWPTKPRYGADTPLASS